MLGGTSAFAAQKELDTLAAAIEETLSDSALRPAWCGVLIQSLQDDSILFERNADKLYLPASNNKLLTSSAALALLGPEFVYTTRIHQTGSLSADGTLHGDLILRGSGDPILSPSDLKALARQIYDAGVRRIAGQLRYDDSLFDQKRLGEGWQWDDEPYYYSAQISALNLNQNLINLQPLPGPKPGTPIQLIVGPITGYVAVKNRAITGRPKSRNTLRFDRVRGQNVIIIKGSLPIDIPPEQNFPTGVTIENPSRFTAEALRQFLRDLGVQVPSKVFPGPSVPAKAAVIAQHHSPPLSELLQRFNKPSDNLIGECLLKTIGAVKTGKGSAGRQGTGPKAASAWFATLGLDCSRLIQVDGSGLSRLNCVSPRNLVRLLAAHYKRPDFTIFYDSLPIAGVDGTLKKRMRETAAENNCRAKTGTLFGVSGLSGYVSTQDGELLAFSILMNNYQTSSARVRQAQDQIVALLANFKRNREPMPAAGARIPTPPQ